MSMTKVDYELVGTTLGHEVSFLHSAGAAGAAHIIQHTAGILADAFALDNPKFDRDRFLELVHAKASKKDSGSK